MKKESLLLLTVLCLPSLLFAERPVSTSGTDVDHGLSNPFNPGNSNRSVLEPESSGNAFQTPDVCDLGEGVDSKPKPIKIKKKPKAKPKTKAIREPSTNKPKKVKEPTDSAFDDEAEDSEDSSDLFNESDSGEEVLASRGEQALQSCAECHNPDKMGELSWDEVESVLEEDPANYNAKMAKALRKLQKEVKSDKSLRDQMQAYLESQ